MTGLAQGLCSIARTKRRRFLWCAYWTGEPTAEPFRKPDAWAGGARTEEEAHAAAEAAAGMPLRRGDGRWARAFMRVLAGAAPFPEGRREPVVGESPPRPIAAHEVLGIARGATQAEIKRAFRALALVTHPDQGGDPAAFQRVKRAYESALRKASRGRAR